MRGNYCCVHVGIYLLIFRTAAAIVRQELFPYGVHRGDLLLQDGDDETSEVVKLKTPFTFFEAQFRELYVGTNGIISTQKFPRETQYIDESFPTEFPVIAPFMADIDTTGGRGKIYYREDDSADVLRRAAQEVRRGFPHVEFYPANAFIVTWEDVAAHEELTANSRPSNMLNTFQAVLAYDSKNAYAIFLYPEDGLNFFGSHYKEPYGMQMALSAQVGFCRGEIGFILWKTDGPYYSVTSDEQSVKNLHQSGNVGISGVWLFHIGNASGLSNIEPAEVGVNSAEEPPVIDSTLNNQGRITGHDVYNEADVFTESYYDEDEVTPPTLEQVYPKPNPDILIPDHEDHDFSPNLDILETDVFPDVFPSANPPYPELEGESYPEPEIHTHYGAIGPVLPHPESSENEPHPRIPSHEGGDVQSGPVTDSNTHRNPSNGVQLQHLDNEGVQSNFGSTYPEGDVLIPKSFPVPRNNPSHDRSISVVNVEENIPQTHVFTYNTPNKDTCARHQSECSKDAYCTDYPTGYCCHCEQQFYGNGKHCLAQGATQRVNGKVSGRLLVGRTSVDFNNVDLHAYIVVTDGRAYTAISHIPQLAAMALMPISAIGGLFGWLFALEKPQYENGFSVTGAKFIQRAEVTFSPGNEKISITQRADGLDENNYLSVKTNIQGQLPEIPLDATVEVEPYKELYYYTTSAVTSSAYREYVVTSPSTGSRRLSYQLRQNITYQDCIHSPRHTRATQQLGADRVFVLYTENERVLRYAMTNQIGPIEDKPEATSPCYDGSHECDTSAQCSPGVGTQYTCECAAGYQGDGRNCIDIDECAEDYNRCGSHAACINFPGRYRCECQTGYRFATDGRTCVPIAPVVNPCEDGHHNCDSAERARCIHHGGSEFSCQCLPGYTGNGYACFDVDECTGNRCHRNAACHNTPGTFYCLCNPGYAGDGFQCAPAAVTTRPKTPCEFERDRLSGGEYGPRGPRPPIVGHHIPQCDENGNYSPRQCHSSTGYCWCVDTNGQEIHGTRTPPGTTPSRCGPPEPRPQTVCERWKQSILEHYGGRASEDQYVPQCDEFGNFHPLQCHGNSGYCWCVDKDGREIPGTRTTPGVPPACIPSVAPPTVRPTRRPDVVIPPTGTFLLYAQGQQIGYLPLSGTRFDTKEAKTLLAPHGSIVVGIDYECNGKMVYWTDVAGRSISRVSLEPGAEPEVIISSGLISPEGIAIDYRHRTMYWTDSGHDKIEKADLDGQHRRVLFDTDLVNPRAIVVDPIRGNLYWTDWYREAPKIEVSSLDGTNRRMLVNTDLGLPNGLTVDLLTGEVCWADAGTKKLECILANGQGRHTIHSNLNYPFGIVRYLNQFYYTDWRRDGIINVSKEHSQLTEYLPQQRSHVYGITVAYPYCPSGRK